MSGPRIGELFAGYGGLGAGVQSVYGGEIAWVSDIDKGANKILAHRFPGVPNHGDITTIDWSTVEPVDILTGGSPCQDLSHAGRRAGMTEGTRSNLWVAMREAIAQLRPAVVVWENVRGAYSAEAVSAGTVVTSRERRRGGRSNSRVVYEGGLLENASGGPTLRALGRVLGDLSDLGYDCRWHGLRAADVGAPHGRFRVFVVARDAHRDEQGSVGGSRGRTGTEPGRVRLAADAERGGWDGRSPDAIGSPVGGRAATAGGGEGSGPLFRTLTSQLAINGGSQHPDKRKAGGHGPTLADEVEHLLPTPAVNDMGEGKTVERWDEWTADMQSKHGNGNGHGKSLAIEAQRLLPTPRTANNENRQSEKFAGEDGNFYGLLHNPERWGDYASAIARWERVLGRPAPAPTMTSTKGNPQLSPAFVEWLMGLPAGWVDDVPGLTRNEKLKALGNGVVSQQCAEALRVMASWAVAA